MPFSLKVAVTAGALTGGAIALAQNRERVWEFSEHILQKGADFCRQRVEAHKKNMVYATDVEDSEYKQYETDEDSDEDISTASETELLTPNESENEWEHDLDMTSLD